MSRSASPLIAALLCALLCAACQRSSTKVTPVAADDLAKRIAAGGAPVILDVRTPAEYAAGHIPGAINIPHDQVAARWSEIPAAKSAEVVVHCEAGKRAAVAEGILVQEGYSDVRDLQGHMSNWRQSGLPVETSKTP